MVKNIRHVVDIHSLPVVQTNENVAFLDTGFGGDAVILNADDFESAMEVAIEVGNLLSRELRQEHAEFASNEIVVCRGFRASLGAAQDELESPLRTLAPDEDRKIFTPLAIEEGALNIDARVDLDVADLQEYIAIL